jgi:hypothetical protein
MLDPDVFTYELHDVEDAFSKKYKKRQLKLIYKYVQDLSNDEFKRICDVICEQRRSWPTPQDFLEFAVTSRRTNKGYNKPIKVESKIECTDCYDSGVFRIVFTEGEFNPAVCCHCSKGEYWQSIWNLPRWDREFEMLFEKVPIDPKKFIPPDIKNKNTNVAIMIHARKWRKVIEKSRHYWKQKKENHERAIKNEKTR